MWGDNSQNTRMIANKVYMLLVILILLVSGSIASAVGHVRGYQKEVRSSFPIGSSVLFERSNAELVIKDYYVDRNKDVLIVRMSPNSESAGRLPHKGSDYSVYLYSKSLEGYKEVPVMFGRMSTDGDFFLILPKPTDDIYSVFIMNTNYVSPVDINKQTEGEVADINADAAVDDAEVTSSISKALSEYDYDPTNPTSASYVLPGNINDMVSFRVTTDPFIKSAKYMPKTIDADLVKDRKFQFETFFNELFKKPVIKRLDTSVNDIAKQLELNQANKKELEDSLAKNPNDAEARQSLDTLIQTEKSLKDEQLKLARQSADYSALEYDPNLFSDLQTKATIVSKDVTK